MISKNQRKIILLILMGLTIACSVPEGVSLYSKTDPISIQFIIHPRTQSGGGGNIKNTVTPNLATLAQTLTIAYTITPLPTFTPTASETPTSTPTATSTMTPTDTETPVPTETEIPVDPENSIPEVALIEGLTGYPQTSNLDCEARSAVDFAGYFGVTIDEMEFQENLAHSDDPEEGFVGNCWDPRGQLPPDSYGVHARPVADLLRIYGINAWDYKGFSYEDLQKEVAAGRPVIAWVTGNTEEGEPVSYTPSNGNSTTVARFEHTVIVIGYQPSYVTLVDGGMTYHRSIDTFLISWGVLGNMVIVNQFE